MKGIFLISMAVAVLLTGCKQKRVWGQGDPPDNWQEFFGNNNVARLDYMQTQAINRQGQALAELVERVRKLEEPVDVNDLDVEVQGASED